MVTAKRCCPHSFGFCHRGLVADRVCSWCSDLNSVFQRGAQLTPHSTKETRTDVLISRGVWFEVHFGLGTSPMHRTWRHVVRSTAGGRRKGAARGNRETLGKTLDGTVSLRVLIGFFRAAKLDNLHTCRHDR